MQPWKRRPHPSRPPSLRVLSLESHGATGHGGTAATTIRCVDGARRRSACSGARRSAARRIRTRAVGAAWCGRKMNDRRCCQGANSYSRSLSFNETGVNSTVLVKVVRRIDTDPRTARCSPRAQCQAGHGGRRPRGTRSTRERVGQSVRCAETVAAYGAKTRGSGKAGSVHSFKLFSAQRLRRLRRRTAAPGISSRL